MLEEGARKLLSQEEKWEAKLHKVAQESEARKVEADSAAQNTYLKLVQNAQKDIELFLADNASQSDAAAKQITDSAKAGVKKVVALENKASFVAKDLAKSVLEEVDL